ncbi:hypothetical protein ACLB2K_009735 [Fragaria x ananassa]
MDDVGAFYNRYAKKAGFSIRSHTNAMSKDNTTLMRKEYVCYKQGDSKVQGEKRKRGLPKVGCKARIAAMRKKTGRYAISVFVEGHNHALTSPSRVHLLKSHHRISKVNKVLSEQLSLVNVKKHKQFEFFGVQAGGIENIGCTQRDLYNYGRNIRQEKKGHDGDLLYMHFQTEKEKESSFVFRMESDEENKSFQEKKKGPSSVIKNKSSNISTADLKHGSSPNKHSSSGTGNVNYVLKEKSTAVMQSKSSSRARMKDVSNFGATSGSKSTAQYQRKSKGSSCSTAKHQAHISKKLSFGSMEDNVFGSVIPAIFGRCPLEEDDPGSSKVPFSNDADSYVK